MSDSAQREPGGSGCIVPIILLFALMFLMSRVMVEMEATLAVLHEEAHGVPMEDCRACETASHKWADGK